MAASEARYVDGEPPVHADEGQEPSEFDPAVESTFTAMTSNVSANMPLLSSVFGGAESTGFDYDAFETFILGLGLRHFSPNEFLALGNRNRAGACAGKNHLPPRHLWQNIANTALMIDEIRARLGTPIFITSAYRSPAYNTCIGGVAGSQHMRFNALDWYSTSGTPAQWEAVANAVKASDPRFRGFVKDYPSQNFVHIDTRDA
jgi:N-acetylmuramoyl-L-alanine amidase